MSCEEFSSFNGSDLIDFVRGLRDAQHNILSLIGTTLKDNLIEGIGVVFTEPGVVEELDALREVVVSQEQAILRANEELKKRGLYGNEKVI